MPPEHTPASPSRRAAWALGLLAGLVPVGLHVDFLLRDARLPRDLGLFYQRVPALWRWMTGGGGDLDRLLSDLGAQPGGGYEVVLAAWLAVLGRSPELFRAVDVAWMVALLALVAACAIAIAVPHGGVRHHGESPAPTAALVAVLLAASMPFLAIFPRLSWIHVPEAALVLGAALPWLRDPALGRGLLWTALLGALAVQLRSSALAWLAPLGLAMALGVHGRRPPWRRLAVVAAAWLLGALPALVGLARYLGPKLEARERYARDVPPFFEQVLLGAGPLVPFVAAGGAWLAWRHRRGGPVRLLTAWVAATVLLWAGFRAGMDNFLVGFAALAVLASVGLARWGWPAVGLAALPWLLLHLPRLLPPPPEPSAVATALGTINQPPQASLHSVYRPFQRWGRAHLDSLLRASCPPQGRCVLAVDQGLLVPYSEEAGHLEVFLAGLDHVDLVDLRAQGRVTELPRVHALVHYDCGERDVPWRQRFPRSLDRLFHVIQKQGLAPAWTMEVSGDCQVLWFVPGGRLVDPAALPTDGRPLDGEQLPAMTDPRAPHPLDLEGGPERRGDGRVRPQGSHRPDPEGAPPRPMAPRR